VVGGGSLAISDFRGRADRRQNCPCRILRRGQWRESTTGPADLNPDGSLDTTFQLARRTDFRSRCNRTQLFLRRIGRKRRVPAFWKRSPQINDDGSLDTTFAFVGTVLLPARKFPAPCRSWHSPEQTDHHCGLFKPGGSLPLRTLPGSRGTGRRSDLRCRGRFLTRWSWARWWLNRTAMSSSGRPI